MSMGSADIWVYEFEHDFPFGLPGYKWVDKHGIPHKLTDMTEGYIRNCMRIVGEDDEWYGHFLMELKRRGRA